MTGTCLISTLLYYAPLSLKDHFIVTLLAIGLLVVPVADRPTNAVTMLISIFGSLAICFFLWVYHYMKVRGILCNHEEPTKYSMISGSDVEDIEHNDPGLIPECQDNYEENGQVEMISPSTEMPNVSISIDTVKLDKPLQNNKKPSLNYRPFVMLHFPGGKQKRMSSVGNSPVNGNMRSCSNFFQCGCLIVLGVVMGIIGLVCFVLQSRENYWYMHSLWHVFIMGAAYPVLAGREPFYNYVSEWLLR